MPKIENKEHLQKVVSESRSVGDVARRLGYAPAKGNKMPGGVYKFIKGKLFDWEIDTSHFVGQRWAKGKTRQTDDGIGRMALKRDAADDLVFCEHSRICNTTVYRRLVMEGKAEKCDECGISEWNGKPLRVQLDHINGVNDDNRRVNLRFLCPNCHSQTETYSRGNVAGVA